MRAGLLPQQGERDVDGVLTVVGFSFAGTGQNAGLVFVELKDWSERKKSSQSVQALATRATRYFSTVRDAVILALAPPAVWSSATRRAST